MDPRSTSRFHASLSDWSFSFLTPNDSGSSGEMAEMMQCPGGAGAIGVNVGAAPERGGPRVVSVACATRPAGYCPGPTICTSPGLRLKETIRRWWS